MRTITINVSEPVYEEFRRAARRLGRPASELIRDAMEQYQRDKLLAGGDLTSFRPRSVGRVLRPLDPSDDLLDEMLNGDSLAS